MAHKNFGISTAKADSDDDTPELMKVSAQYDLLEEIQRQKEEDEEEEGYTIEAEMILRAWKRFRPVNIQEDAEPGHRRKKPRTQQKNLEHIFGKKFTYELMSKIHLRMYNFQELQSQVDKRAQYKEFFAGMYREKFEFEVNQQEKTNKDIDKEPQEREDAIDEAFEKGEEAKDEFWQEVDMVDRFLQNFIFHTASQRDSQIDLNLILKALPVRVDKSNCYRVELFNFASLQESQIAFANTSQDELFKHYDDRNKSRLRKLRTKATTTEELTEELKILATSVLSILSKIDSTGKSGGLRAAQSKNKENLILTEEEIHKQIKKGIQGFFKPPKKEDDD